MFQIAVRSLFILRKSVCIGNTDAGIDPGFVDIKSTAVFTKDFEHLVPPTKILAGLAGTGHPAKSSQLRKTETTWRIETEEDVDRYVEAMKAKLKNIIEKGTVLNIEF